jgi:signal recognition particle receptor subunit beta
MVQFNFSERTIKAKVVYYGPAQSGKTTNLEQIHRITDPAGNNRLISLNTAQDRTLFFDLLPFSLGAVSGYDFKIQLYTVPGQVQYNATRRVVLAGADAVVFVADSQRSQLKENMSAFENMKVNLLANRLVPEKVPLVIQYNKQDLGDLLPRGELDRGLNIWGRKAFPAVAARGEGVIDTFVAIVQEMLAAIAVKYNLKEKGLDPSEVPAVVEHAFQSLLKQVSAQAVPEPHAPAPPPPPRVVVSQPPDAGPGVQAGSPESSPVQEELLHRAIRSNVELAEALTDLVREMNQGLGMILSHADLLLSYRDEAKRAAAVGHIQNEASRMRRLIQELGQAAARPRPPAPVAQAPAPAATGPVNAAALDGLLSDAVASARALLDARGVSVENKVAPGTPPPRCPPANLRRAASALLNGIAAFCPPGSAIVLRSERKPVLLRGRNGETRRDFLMLALGHGGSLSSEEQQRLLQGQDPGPLGEACRLVRQMGGFVRFAPLPGGVLETRVFLPTV